MLNTVGSASIWKRSGEGERERERERGGERERERGRERERERERESEREREGEGGRESSENFPLKLVRSFHCEWGGVTAWTEPQRLCNAAPQRTSIQLYYQLLQFSSLDTTMYSPYCLTQVWTNRRLVFFFFSTLFSRCPVSVCVFFSGMVRLRSVSTVCGYSVVLWAAAAAAAAAAACHLLRF